MPQRGPRSPSPACAAPGRCYQHDGMSHDDGVWIPWARKRAAYWNGFGRIRGVVVVVESSWHSDVLRAAQSRAPRGRVGAGDPCFGTPRQSADCERQVATPEIPLDYTRLECPPELGW